MRQDWLRLALGVLPPPPAALAVSCAEGGEAQVLLLGHCDRGLVVRMAADDADATSGVTFVLEQPSGAAFAVVGTITTLKPLDGGQREVLIEVDEVMRWKRRRRIELDVPATVTLAESPMPVAPTRATVASILAEGTVSARGFECDSTRHRCMIGVSARTTVNLKAKPSYG